MAVIIESSSLGEGMHLLKVKVRSQVHPGQFYMVRSEHGFPLLSRPLSVFDRDEDSISFLFKVVGEGTRILSELRPGMEVRLFGPYGRGFSMELPEKNIALVGGGMGAAPLYYTARRLKEKYPMNEITLYLGFQKENRVMHLFENLGVKTIYSLGGYISEEVVYEDHEVFYTCGPEIMMKRVAEHGIEQGKPVYVSLEKHMACGVGACLGCTCKTQGGNKRVCKEGPVFPGEEIFYE